MNFLSANMCRQRMIVTIIVVLAGRITALPSSDLAFRTFRVDVSTDAETGATSLSTDDYGNTYVVGNTYGSFGEPDVQHLSDMSIFIAKFSRSGILVWLTRTGSSFPDEALDAFYFGAVLYVTGATKGNVSKSAALAESSIGLQDGFVFAYDSFTGKRKWSRQIGKPKAFTEINSVTVSSKSGVIVAGHSNSSILSALEDKVNGDSLFIARLNHKNGHVEQSAQHEIRPGLIKLVPRQIISSGNDFFIHVIVEVDNHNLRKESIFVSLFEENYNISTLHSLASSGMNKVSQGLVEDGETGKIIISYSVATDGPETSRDFGLQTLSEVSPGNFTSSMALADLDSRSDDICKGIVINQAKYAFMLGSVSKGNRGENETLGVWIYDLQNDRSIGSFEADQRMFGSSMRVAGFKLHDTGDLVFAGVRIPENSNQREILLGTFGIPQSLKKREPSGTLPLSFDSNGNSASNSVSDVNQAAVETAASGNGLFARGPNGKLGTSAILIICLCVALSLLLAVFVCGCLLRVNRARRAEEQQEPYEVQYYCIQ